MRKSEAIALIEAFVAKIKVFFSKEASVKDYDQALKYKKELDEISSKTEEFDEDDDINQMIAEATTLIDKAISVSTGTEKYINPQHQWVYPN